MRTFVRFLYIFSLTAICVACSSDSDSDDGNGGADQAIGGIWFGTDNEGLEILGASTESGRIHWVSPDTGEQGFGTASVNGTAVTINYTWVAPYWKTEARSLLVLQPGPYKNISRLPLLRIAQRTWGVRLATQRH